MVIWDQGTQGRTQNELLVWSFSWNSSFSLETWLPNSPSWIMSIHLCCKLWINCWYINLSNLFTISPSPLHAIPSHLGSAPGGANYSWLSQALSVLGMILHTIPNCSWQVLEPFKLLLKLLFCSQPSCVLPALSGLRSISRFCWWISLHARARAVNLFGPGAGAC